MDALCTGLSDALDAYEKSCVKFGKEKKEEEVGGAKTVLERGWLTLQEALLMLNIKQHAKEPFECGNAVKMIFKELARYEIPQNRIFAPLLKKAKESVKGL